MARRPRSERGARALLAEHGIFICGFPEHQHDSPTAVHQENESGAPVAESPVHPESRPGTDEPTEGDLPEKSDFTEDVLIAAGRLYADIQTEGAANVSLDRYCWVLGLLTGTVSRLQAENLVMREMLQNVLDVKVANRE